MIRKGMAGFLVGTMMVALLPVCQVEASEDIQKDENPIIRTMDDEDYDTDYDEEDDYDDEDYDADYDEEDEDYEDEDYEDEEYDEEFEEFEEMEIESPCEFYTFKKKKNAILLTWEMVEDASGYLVYRQENNGAFKLIKNITDPEEEQYWDKSLNQNSKYGYKIITYAEDEETDKVYYSEDSEIESVDMKTCISTDELSVSSKSVKLKKKKSKTISIKYPKGRSKKQIKSITYKSNKAKVAKVSKKGKITAVKKGNANIKVTVKLVNGDSKTFTVKVKVK